jgi:hypothetical protein
LKNNQRLIDTKAYVQQSSFNYGVSRVQWYRSCYEGINNTENHRHFTQALGGASWHYQGDGDDYGTFGAGRRPPHPCCSMPRQGNWSLSPTILRLRKASGCFVARLHCLIVRYLSSSKSVVSRRGKNALRSNLLRHLRRLRVRARVSLPVSGVISLLCLYR